jgi:hypothetical protein
MSRFNSIEEVRAWAAKAAASDLQRHRTKGHDPNPYCTPGARSDWQRGFDGAQPRSWELASTYDWHTQYQRGRAMARLMQQHEETNV